MTLFFYFYFFLTIILSLKRSTIRKINTLSICFLSNNEQKVQPKLDNIGMVIFIFSLFDIIMSNAYRAGYTVSDDIIF